MVGYCILMEDFKYTVSGNRTCEVKGLDILGLHSQLSVWPLTVRFGKN